MALRLVGQELFVPQSYRWGEEAQVDWYEAYADIGGERENAHVFCVRSMPVEEPSIVLSHMPAGRPFWKRTSGRSLTLAGYSKSFAMTT
jgi:hypothetical protein